MILWKSSLQFYLKVFTMKLIIFLAIFHVSAYSAKVKTLLPKIIGGRDAEEFEFPYVVSIRRAELEVLFGEPYHICGGSILNTNTVLTASHCLFDPFGNHLSQPGSYIVVAGLLRMWSDTETTKTFFVSNIYKHPNFDMEKLLNDIAVLKVAPDFTFDLPSIQPISIETKRNLSEGTSCSVHGWGTLLLDYPLYPDILQTVDLKISNFDHCNQTYEGIVDPETQICAYESEKDSCYGKKNALKI